MAPPLSELPMPPLTDERLVFLADADRIVRFMLGASLTLLVWDHLLTLRREIGYMWRGKWTISKCLFFFNRYVTLVMLAGNTWISSGDVKGLTDNFCQKWLLVGAAVELLCISFVSFVILFRLHAVWGGSRTTFLVLLFFWFLSLTASIIIYFRVVYPVRNLLYHEEYFNICFAIIPNLYLQWIPDALLHILMLTVLVWKAIATPRDSQTHMSAIMYREGVLYYSTTSVILLSGVIIWRYGDMAWIGIPLYVGWVLLQLAMSHLLLSWRSIQAFQRQAELISVPYRQPTPVLRSVSPIVSVESHGDYVLNPMRSNTSSSGYLNTWSKHGDDGSLFFYKDEEGRRAQGPGSSRSLSPEVLRENVREHKMRVKTRTGNYRDSRWWWLWGRGSVGDVSVDAAISERWDPGDVGPGLKESRIGRYDHWL